MRDATAAALGESRILRAFLPIIENHNAAVKDHQHQQGAEDPLLVGPGDDCAVFAGSPTPTVLTTDTLVEGEDFLDPWPAGLSSGGYEVGYKAATQNLADIAAMGAEPVTLVVSLSMPAHTTYGWVEDFARGITDSIVACGAHSCTVSGGDLGTSSDITVSITAMGRMYPDTPKPVLRSGAQAGDTVAFAGQVGWADAGLRLLLQSHNPYLADIMAKQTTGKHPRCDDKVVQRALTAQLRPTSPVPAGVLAARAGATAMLDVSDGLLKDAERIACASAVDISLSAEAIEALSKPLVPLAQAILHGQPRNEDADSYVSLAQECVLGGGEDHGLLACVPSGALLPEGFVALGSCLVPEGQQPRVLLGQRQAQARGWEHYQPF